MFEECMSTHIYLIILKHKDREEKKKIFIN